MGERTRLAFSMQILAGGGRRRCARPPDTARASPLLRTRLAAIRTATSRWSSGCWPHNRPAGPRTCSPVPTPRDRGQADDAAGAQRLHRSHGVQAAAHGRRPGMGQASSPVERRHVNRRGTVTANGAVLMLADGDETEFTRFRAEFTVRDARDRLRHASAAPCAERVAARVGAATTPDAGQSGSRSLCWLGSLPTLCAQAGRLPQANSEQAHLSRPGPVNRPVDLPRGRRCVPEPATGCHTYVGRLALPG